MATHFALRHAVHCIRHCGIIAYPTETVYGLGCDPLCDNAVQGIINIKGRDVSKGLILVASRLEQLDEFIDVPDRNDRAALIGETEPTSWIVPASEDTPTTITGGRTTVAIRVSPHPDVMFLCDHLGHALVSTSANLSGTRPASSALQLHRVFDGLVNDILISSSVMSGQSSKIRDLETRKLLR